MGIALGLTAAIVWGIADYMARFATRRIGTFRTLFYMQLAGFLFLSVLIEILGGVHQFTAGTTARGWEWIVLAGLINTGSTLALYRSFEIGTLAVVAPIAASYPALTVVLSILSGETIRRARAFGLLAAVIGLVLTATSFSKERRKNSGEPHLTGHMARGVKWAVVAAIGYGTLFWMLGFRVMPALGGIVSVWAIRFTTFATLAVLARPARQSTRPPQGIDWWLVGGIGVVDSIAFVSNNLALKTEQVAVASVLSSLYGAVTVLLAAVFLRERLEWSQWLGIGLIFAGIAFLNA